MIFDIENKKRELPALISEQGQTLSFGDLQDAMEDFCDHLPCRQRSVLFCMCRNEPGAVLGYLGALECGMVPLLLDANLPDEQLQIYLERYRPAFFWTSNEWAADHPGLLREQHLEQYTYGLWTTGNDPYPVADELALLLATSGSTGDPKLVRLSRKNLESNAASIMAYLHLNEEERPITTLPMQYTYGLSIINSHLLAGACILLTAKSYVQTEFWNFFKEQNATSFGGVPYTYEILKKIHLFDKKLPSLHSITQAGGRLSVPLQKETAQWAFSQGISFYVMYGQTEATARMSYLPPEMCLKKPGSIGLAIPGGRFWLADENGKEISGADTVGELVYEGENVSLGYAKSIEDLLQGDERNGILFTGDMAKRDEDGYYYITGRKKRFVKLYGIRISLDACEEFLREKYPGAEAACTGSDACLKIFLAGGPADTEETERELADYLNLSAKAFRCIPVREIPKTPAGKIWYAKLEEI